MGCVCVHGVCCCVFFAVILRLMPIVRECVCSGASEVYKRRVCVCDWTRTCPSSSKGACVCVCVGVCVCVRVCERVCVRVCECVCVRERVCVCERGRVGAGVGA